jgi:hypothetical protein
MIHYTGNWQKDFAAWQAFSRDIGDRARRVKNARDDRAWALAASVGIPRCGCSLHNASTDTAMSGWCEGNPLRLKVAKRAVHIHNDWRIVRLADRIADREYMRLMSARKAA